MCQSSRPTSPPGADLAADFQARFGAPLEAEALNQSHQIVIVAAARTPQGRLKGQLAPLTAVQLGAAAISGALERGGIPADVVDRRTEGPKVLSSPG